MTATVPTAVSAPDVAEAVDPQVGRILDAAYREFTAGGVRSTTMNRVAESAGLGVATVYRRFPQKALLVRAVILREVAAATSAVAGAMQGADSVEEQCAEGFSAFAHAVSARPLLVRLLRGDTEQDGSAIAPGELVDQIIAMTRDYLAAWIRDLQATGCYTSVDPEVVAEIEARLALSLVIAPDGRIPIGDANASREFARSYLVPLLGRP